jgi:hypothetical protein
MRRSLVLASLILLAPAIASADTAIATDAPKAERRIDTRLGLLLGGGDIGDVTGPSTGVHASLGYRIGGVTVFGEYDYLGVGDSMQDSTSRDGRMTRGGGSVRWQIADVAPKDAPLGLEFWVEGGAGVERVSWSRGGLLYRPDATLGFGFEVDGRGWRTPKPRHFGLYLAFRAMIARAPRTDDPATCEGPCTVATPPSRIDVSLFFHMGLHWGR